MKRTILALALLVALVLPGMAKAEGTGMYLAPKFLMTIQETGTIERSGMGGVDEYSQFTLGGALAAGYDFWPPVSGAPACGTGIRPARQQRKELGQQLGQRGLHLEQLHPVRQPVL